MSVVVPSAPNRVSLTQIIELGVQKTYHDLTLLAELLPHKTDMERKVEIVNFAERTRQLFIRLLALVKWAGGASKIEQCMDIVSFLDKQALLFINTADNMLNINKNTLVHARLPPFQLPCAVEVLTLGTYSRMPTCVRDRIVPSDPITIEEKRSTIARLDHIIEQRLSTSKIHPSMRNLRIEFGRVIFHVENEFDLKLTLLGDSPTLPWYVLGIDLLVEDADTSEGKDLVHPLHLKAMKGIIQQKMSESQQPLVDVFSKLHNFCLSLQIEVLHDQTERLMRERLANLIKIKEHIPGQELAITYWGGKNVMKIQTDTTDTSKPLRLSHQPELNTNSGLSETLDRENIFRPGNVSIEQLITDTIQKRAYIKLCQLATELRDKKYGNCTISGMPSLLHVSCLEPCASSEQLIISIDLYGQYLAHVPQYEKSCPLADNIQESLNSNRSKLGTYFDQLKIWLTKKRCIRTIDYLSVTATESLPLCSRANYARLDAKVPRIFFQFNKYNHYYLMAEFFISDQNPFGLNTRYSLLVTEPGPNTTSDGLDIVESELSNDSVKRVLVVVEEIIRLDVQKIIASNYCYESSAQDEPIKLISNGISGKSELSARSSDLPISNDERSHKTDDVTNARPPVSLVDELPQLVSFCEEKLAHLALEKELRNRNIKYEVLHSETSGNAYCITFNQVPKPKFNGYSDALRRDTVVMTICLQEKPQSSKIWHCSYIFRDSPIITQSAKEQSPLRFVFTPYESLLLNSTMVSKFIDDTQLDWACMAHLYDVVREFARDLRIDPSILDSITLKSFNYKKLVILYGPQRNFAVTLMWKPAERKFHLIFSVVGGPPFSINPHTCMTTHYKHEFNQHKSIKSLISNLNLTLRPLSLLHSLPVYSFLGLTSGRPQVPAASFCIMPLSTTRVKLTYRNWHSIDIRMRQDGMLIVRDGACSKFDKNKIVEDLNPIVNFESLLGKTYTASCYALKYSEFENIFNVNQLEQHLGISFMIKNIHKKLTTPTYFPNVRALPPMNDSSAICFASEHMQYRFFIDTVRRTVQMKAQPLVDDWLPEEIEVLERYFEIRVACYPFKADSVLGFCRLLFNFPRNILRDFIKIYRMELFPDHANPNIHWNIASCQLIPSSCLFVSESAGMSSICPLRGLTLFVVELTKRSIQGSPVPPIYLPLTYQHNINTLCIYIPPRLHSETPQYMVNIDAHLRRFCQRFNSENLDSQACPIYPAIESLVTNPNLLMR